VPNFRYTSLSPDGKETSDVILAANAADAAAKLKAEGRFVLSIEGLDAEKTSKGMATDLSLEGLLGIFQPAKKKDTVMLFRQLSVLLDAGIGIVQALSILERQANKYGVRRLLMRVRMDVESGENLSDSMAKHGHIFSEYVISMIQSAELSGEMELTLKRIAKQLESAAAFKRQLITSMIYPGIVIVMASLIIAFLTLSVIPKFEPLLAGTGQNLPPVTQMLMDISSWAQANWMYVFGGIFTVIFGSILFRKTDEGGLIVDAFLLRIPIFGGIIRCGIVVGFARNMSTLFAGGVPLVDALGIVRNTLGNRAAAGVLDNVSENVLQGENMSEPLRRARAVFPPMVAEMVSTGEETGEIVKVLDLTADIYEKILEANVKRMSALIEPLIILVLGGTVGIVFYGLISGMLAVYGL
jgi:type II secretory pathway component PulF